MAQGAEKSQVLEEHQGPATTPDRCRVPREQGRAALEGQGVCQVEKEEREFQAKGLV